MSLLVKRFVLVLALAVMPLQGVAAVLTVVLCHGEAQMHAMHGGATHDHGTAHAGHPHGHEAVGQDESPAGNAAFHPCCNQTASAPPAAVTPRAPADFPAQAFPPATMHDLFIPDRPQRPPLA